MCHNRDCLVGIPGNTDDVDTLVPGSHLQNLVYTSSIINVLYRYIYVPIYIYLNRTVIYQWRRKVPKSGGGGGGGGTQTRKICTFGKEPI